MSSTPKKMNGKWVVLIIFIVSIIGALIRWRYVPRTNPRQADPGSPYYSPDPR